MMIDVQKIILQRIDKQKALYKKTGNVVYLYKTCELQSLLKYIRSQYE